MLSPMKCILSSPFTGEERRISKEELTAKSHMASLAVREDLHVVAASPGHDLPPHHTVLAERLATEEWFLWGKSTP